MVASSCAASDGSVYRSAVQESWDPSVSVGVTNADPTRSESSTSVVRGDEYAR